MPPIAAVSEPAARPIRPAAADSTWASASRSSTSAPRRAMGPTVRGPSPADHGDDSPPRTVMVRVFRQFPGVSRTKTWSTCCG